MPIATQTAGFTLIARRLDAPDSEVDRWHS